MSSSQVSERASEANYKEYSVLCSFLSFLLPFFVLTWLRGRIKLQAGNFHRIVINASCVGVLSHLKDELAQRQPMKPRIKVFAV